MSYAQQTYALNLDQAESLILAVGDNRTVLLQGHMGTGKSSLLTTLAAKTGSCAMLLRLHDQGLG